MKNKYLYYSLVVLLLLLNHSTTTAQTLQTPEQSLGEFLDENGRFNNPEGYNGGLDFSGFDVYKHQSAEPMFTPMGGLLNNVIWSTVVVVIEKIFKIREKWVALLVI